MSEDWKVLFEAHRKTFVASARSRIDEISDLLDGLERNEAADDALDNVMNRFHQLAGSAGSYGFHGVSQKSAEAEALCLSALGSDGALETNEIVQCREIIEQLLGEMSDTA